jgi:hypothetical protein
MPYALNTSNRGLGLRGTNFKLYLPKFGGFAKITSEEQKDLMTNKGVRAKLEKQMFIFREDQPSGRTQLHTGRSSEKEIPDNLKPTKLAGSKGGTVAPDGMEVTGGESTGLEEVKVQEAKPSSAKKAKAKGK